MINQNWVSLSRLVPAAAVGLTMLLVPAAALVLTMLLVPGTANALPTAPGHFVSFVDVASGDAVGDVVVVDGAIFVGVGPQNMPGAGQLVRIDAPGTPGQTETVVAEGFTAISGMDYDAVGGRLIVADNGLEFGGSTGDNVYAVSDPFGSPADAPDADDLKILLDGALPGAADVSVDPTDPDRLFLTDASSVFPPLGRLLEASISGGTASVLESGLGFAAGLATDGATLWVGDVDGTSFEGLVSELAIAAPGGGLDPLVTGLAGQFDLELLPNGLLLASSGGQLLRIDPSNGGTSVVASGFGFASGLWAGDSGRLYALDGFASGVNEPSNRIWIFTPVPEPATGLLLACGLLGLSLRRGRD